MGYEMSCAAGKIVSGRGNMESRSVSLMLSGWWDDCAMLLNLGARILNIVDYAVGSLVVLNFQLVSNIRQCFDFSREDWI